MNKRDTADILSGIAFSLLGIFVTIYAMMTLSMGTPTRMGDGAFPVALGGILTLLGILIVVPAFFRPGAMPELLFVPPFFVLASVCAFALMVRPFGLLPAAAATIVISSLADRKAKPLGLLLLVLGLCLFNYAVFRVGLDLPVTMIQWPFQ
jgi:hypothetical protein